MHGGVEVTSTTVRAGAGLPASITYETKLIDTEIESRTAPPYALPLRAQIAHTRGGPAARSPLANGGLRAFTGDRILTDADERFDIASTTDFTPRVDITASTTKGAAWQALDDYLAEHPGEAGQLQVVPVGELEDL
jgi:hypothetical protein